MNNDGDQGGESEEKEDKVKVNSARLSLILP